MFEKFFGNLNPISHVGEEMTPFDQQKVDEILKNKGGSSRQGI